MSKKGSVIKQIKKHANATGFLGVSNEEKNSKTAKITKFGIARKDFILRSISSMAKATTSKITLKDFSTNIIVLDDLPYYFSFNSMGVPYQIK